MDVCPEKPASPAAPTAPTTIERRASTPQPSGDEDEEPARAEERTYDDDERRADEDDDDEEDDDEANSELEELAASSAAPAASSDTFTSKEELLAEIDRLDMEIAQTELEVLHTRTMTAKSKEEREGKGMQSRSIQERILESNRDKALQAQRTIWSSTDELEMVPPTLPSSPTCLTD